MIDATNHNVSGTSATAVTRSANQCREPRLAEPSPMARASGERKVAIHQLPADEQRPATQAATVSTTLAATTAHPEI